MLNCNLQATGPAIHAGDTHIPYDLPELVHPIEYRRIQYDWLRASIQGLSAKWPKVGAAARCNVPLTGEYGGAGLIHGKNLKSAEDVEFPSTLQEQIAE